MPSEEKNIMKCPECGYEPDNVKIVARKRPIGGSNVSKEWSIEYGPDGVKITLNGKDLTEEKEIIEFIDKSFEKSMLDDLKKKLLNK